MDEQRARLRALREAAASHPDREHVLRLADLTERYDRAMSWHYDDVGDLCIEWYRTGPPPRRVGAVFSALAKDTGWWMVTKEGAPEDGVWEDLALLDEHVFDVHLRNP